MTATASLFRANLTPENLQFLNTAPLVEVLADVQDLADIVAGRFSYYCTAAFAETATRERLADAYESLYNESQRNDAYEAERKADFDARCAALGLTDWAARNGLTTYEALMNYVDVADQQPTYTTSAWDAEDSMPTRAPIRKKTPKVFKLAA